MSISRAVLILPLGGFSGRPEGGAYGQAVSRLHGDEAARDAGAGERQGGCARAGAPEPFILW